MLKQDPTKRNAEEFRSSSPENLKVLLENLKVLEEDLGNNPVLFGERNREARGFAKAMIAEIQAVLEKR